MAEPRLLTDDNARKMARHMRDEHWAFMERLAREGTVNVCLWNKNRQEERPDELRLCLISGMELMEWVRRHQDWFVLGENNLERHTFPVSLTDAGRAALLNRDLYDMEPVYGGLVEPGWQAIPFPRVEVAAHA